jgi:hypothetical protein
VRPNGLELTCLPMPVEEIFFRMARFRAFDAAELSLGGYLVSRPRDPFVAIPVFPSRSFRHSGIYVPAASSVSDPAALAGGTVGVAEYQLTANIWIRGILADRHGPAGRSRALSDRWAARARAAGEAGGTPMRRVWPTARSGPPTSSPPRPWPTR